MSPPTDLRVLFCQWGVLPTYASPNVRLLTWKMMMKHGILKVFPPNSQTTPKSIMEVHRDSGHNPQPPRHFLIPWTESLFQDRVDRVDRDVWDAMGIMQPSGCPLPQICFSMPSKQKPGSV